MGDRLTPDEMRHFLETQVPFVKSLGISCEEVRPGYAQARWTRDSRWLRPGGYLFGGGLMSLADAAIYMAILGQVGLKAMAVTIELKMNFLRPAVGGDVLAQAQVLKLGQRIAYGEVRLFTEDAPDRLIAHATCTYAMPS
ncbi:MAG TPA: PaaI family thioesterase [Candidatus Methylomirabilis sp.]|nr:PaaI family thioesterase [Candidatus Methylomirabilis sp.]